MATLPATGEIVRAYRHLYRGLLRGVQYSRPARFTARDQLRSAFRKGAAGDFNQEKISRTLEFLRGAEKERGIEHKILKNLLHTAYWKVKDSRHRGPRIQPSEVAHGHIMKTAYAHYQQTIAMLNESMDLCLPVDKVS